MSNHLNSLNALLRTEAIDTRIDYAAEIFEGSDINPLATMRLATFDHARGEAISPEDCAAITGRGPRPQSGDSTMNTFRNLADTIMNTAGLDQQQLRRLIWCWQGIVHPGDDRIAADSLARLLDGQPVPERDETVAYAALTAVLPSILDQAALQRAPFRHDKVLNILAASGSTCTLSPWRFVRTWAAEDLAGFARGLGLERRTLRRLEEAPWLGGPVSDPALEALGDLGRWFACNAVSLEGLGAHGKPCEAAATL